MIFHQAIPWEVGNFIPQKLYARKNLVLNLSREQIEILIGCILGDGYITKRGQIVIEQSSHQEEYLRWKFLKLSSLAYGNISRVERFDKRYSKTYISYNFVLRQYFRPWREIFYKDGKKIFPAYIPIVPLTMAVWYMDDGCYSDNECLLSLDGFDQENRRAVQNTFLENYNIQTSLRKNGKLLIRKASEEKFFSMVRPYIISCMQYKIS